MTCRHLLLDHIEIGNAIGDHLRKVTKASIEGTVFQYFPFNSFLTSSKRQNKNLQKITQLQYYSLSWLPKTAKTTQFEWNGMVIFNFVYKKIRLMHLKHTFAINIFAETCVPSFFIWFNKSTQTSHLHIFVYLPNSANLATV